MLDELQYCLKLIRRLEKEPTLTKVQAGRGDNIGGGLISIQEDYRRLTKANQSILPELKKLIKKCILRETTK